MGTQWSAPRCAYGLGQGRKAGAAELLGLAARIYTAPSTERAALADQVIACAVALGGAPEATAATEVSTQ